MPRSPFIVFHILQYFTKSAAVISLLTNIGDIQRM